MTSPSPSHPSPIVFVLIKKEKESQQLPRRMVMARLPDGSRQNFADNEIDLSKRTKKRTSLEGRWWFWSEAEAEKARVL